jgi:hypothetical protein
MKWTEVIKLRVNESDRESVEKGAIRLIDDIVWREGLRKIRLYRHALIGNDLCIRLDWESDAAMPQGSAEGLSLVHLLREFGLTNHSVWIEGKTMKAPLHGGTTDRLQ